MDLIDKVFAKLNREQMPADLKNSILNIPLNHQKKSFNWGVMKQYLPKVAIPALVVMLIAGMLIYQNFGRLNYAAAFELEAAEQDTAGVAVSSSFILKSSKDIPAGDIKKIVKFSPEVEFSVKDLGNNRFELKPTDELNSNVVYKVNIEEGPADREYAWAYQIKAPFIVVSSTPADKTNAVPTNSGIEITFNRENLIDPEKYFSIDPAVPGSFEQYGRTLIFKPSKTLEAGRIYNVTVKRGLEAKGSEDILNEDHTFKFQTGSGEYGNPDHGLEFATDLTQFLPEQKPIFTTYVPAMADGWTAQIYAFKNGEGFVDNYLESRDWDFSWTATNKKEFRDKIRKGQSKVAEFSVQINTINGQSYIEAPEALKSGYYAIIVTDDKDKNVGIAWFQVSELAHYAAFSDDSSLLWLYDFKDQQPVANAEVKEFKSRKLADTNNEGLARFSSPESIKDDSVEINYTYNVKPVFFQVEKKGYLPYFFKHKQQSDYYYYGRWYNQGSLDYWSAVTIDRPVYMPTDTTNFWGMVKPRKGNDVKEVSVGIYSYYYRYIFGYNGIDDEQRPIVHTKVDVSKSDTYEGSLSFDGLTPGQYSVIVKAGDEILESRSFQVAAYSKPVYKLSVTPDRKNVYSGERVRFNISASYYDGSPVSGAKIEYSDNYGSLKLGEVALDKSGKASVTLPMTGDASWPIDSKGIYFRIMDFEESNISQYVRINVFNSKVNIAAKQELNKDGSIKITTTLKDVDLDKANSTKEEDYLGNVIKNRNVKAEITRVTYEKVPSGTYYDYITKTVQTSYTYVTKQEVIGNFDGQTDNEGRWVLEKKLPDDTANYVAKITTDNGLGGTTFQQVYIYRTMYDEYGEGRSNTVLKVNNKDFYEASIGEKLSFEVVPSEQTLLPDDKKTLFYGFQDNISEVHIADGLRWDKEFEKAFKPSMSVIAVNLTSRGFESTSPINVQYKQSDSKLNIDVKSNKQSYKPGEEVQLEVKVTDKDGKPVAAAVNISVVDQAIFDMLGYSYEPEILSELHRSIIVYPESDYTRFDQAQRFADGTGGGGGPDTPRINMMDTAFFKSVSTNNSGLVSLKFKLPDNITQWRIAAAAFNSDELMAGQNTSSIVSELPLGIDVLLNTTYLQGDKPELRVRMHGDEFKQDQETEITVKSSSLNLNTKQKIKGTEGFVTLPELPLGEHLIEIQAKQGQNFDILQEKFTVLQSYYENTISKTYPVAEGLSGIKGADKGLTTLIITDKGKGAYIYDLYGLNYLASSRSDQYVASYYAQKTLKEEFGIGEEPEVLDISRFKRQSIYSLLAYSGEDHELTAQLSAVLSDNYLGKEQTNYFYQTLSDRNADKDRISQSLFALAYLSEPVLTKVELFSSEPELSLENKLYIAIAMARLGNEEKAREYYREHILPEIKFQEDQGWVNSEKEETRNIKLTSLAAVLTAEIGEKSTFEKTWKYLQIHHPQKENNYLEKALAIDAMLERNKENELKVVYTIGKEKHEIELENGQSHEIKLLPNDLAQFSIKGVKGNAELISIYNVPATPVVQPDTLLGISRSYEVNGRATTNFKMGDLVLVKLKVDLSKTLRGNSYQITDYLPSGLKPIYTYEYFGPYSYRYGDWDYCKNASSYADVIHDNKVNITVYGETSCPGGIVNLQYLARVSNPGKFKADPAVISADADKTLKAISNSTTVEINK